MTPFEGWSNWETWQYQVGTDYEFWQTEYIESYLDMDAIEFGQVIKEREFQIAYQTADTLLKLPLGEALYDAIGAFLDSVNYTEIAREVIKHANESQLD